MSKLHHYWKELQRRHVVKAGIAYLVAAWLIIQVLSIFFPAFEASTENLRTAIIILAIGFPIWLVLAWMFDFSSEGIKRTEDVPFNAEDSKRKNLSLNRFIIGGLSIAVILLVLNTLRLSGKVDEMEGQFLAMEFSNSLAILPFHDLSPNKDQGYFSDGLSRSIYDRLAKNKDLKLISPTSSFKYRDQDVSIEVIADSLGVRYILEGSVQLFDNRYRASINLIDTKNGATIWSKPFDDDLENVLATYDEVAENVGNYLNVTLISPDVSQRKVDPEAYLLYLKAIDTTDRAGHIKNSVIIGDSLINRSLKIDPNYAPSQVMKAQTTFHKTVYHKLMDKPTGLAIAKEAAYKAIELDPDNPLGYMWVSNLSWHERDMKTYQEFYDKTVEKGPNHADVASYQGFCLARTNKVAEANFYDEKAALLSPKHNQYNQTMAIHEMYLSEYEEALKWYNKIDSDWIEWRTLGLAEAKMNLGYFKQAEDLIVTLPDFMKSYARIKMLFLKGKPQEAAAEMNQFLELDENVDGFDLFIGSEYNRYWVIASLYAILGNHDRAFEYLNMAYPEISGHTEQFFGDPDLVSLHDDPRWDAMLDRLGKEFNYDFKNK